MKRFKIMVIQSIRRYIAEQKALIEYQKEMLSFYPSYKETWEFSMKKLRIAWIDVKIELCKTLI